MRNCSVDGKAKIPCFWLHFFFSLIQSSMVSDSILAESDLQGIDVVESEIPIIQQTRERILAEADRVLDNGMKTEVGSKFYSCLARINV